MHKLEILLTDVKRNGVECQNEQKQYKLLSKRTEIKIEIT